LKKNVSTSLKKSASRMGGALHNAVDKGLPASILLKALHPGGDAGDMMMMDAGNQGGFHWA
jgi:hypothetical protein